MYIHVNCHESVGHSCVCILIFRAPTLPTESTTLQIVCACIWSLNVWLVTVLYDETCAWILMVTAHLDYKAHCDSIHIHVLFSVHCSSCLIVSLQWLHVCANLWMNTLWHQIRELATLHMHFYADCGCIFMQIVDELATLHVHLYTDCGCIFMQIVDELATLHVHLYTDCGCIFMQIVDQLAENEAYAILAREEAMAKAQSSFESPDW